MRRYNIIADTVGGDHDNVLVLGAHTDSMSAGPGINDNGSGLIGILETAQQLVKYSTKNAVRFCFWSAEEFRLLGSLCYTLSLTKEEIAKIRLYLNFDMIASQNFHYAVYDGDGSTFNISSAPGSAEIEDFFTGYFEQLGLPTAQFSLRGNSDYLGFLRRGIPIEGVSSGV